MEQSNQHFTELNSTTKALDLSSKITQIKLKNAKDITCMEIFNNCVYIGTRSAKLFVYELNILNDKQKSIELTKQRNFYPHCNTVYSISLSEKLIVVVPSQQQQLIRIWDRKGLQILHGYKGHEKQITSVIFLSDNDHIASIGHDGTARVWEINSNFEFDSQKIIYHGKYPLLALVELNNDVIIFGGDDCFITSWDWRMNTVLYKCFAHPGSINCLLPFKCNLLSIGGDSKLKLWTYKQEVIQQPMSFKTALTVSDQINYPLKTHKWLIQQRKEFQKPISSRPNLFLLNSSQFLICDSNGNVHLGNQELQIISGRIKLNYCQKILITKVYQDMILMIVGRGMKTALKYVPLRYQEDMDNRQKQIIEAFISQNSINSSINQIRVSKNIKKEQLVIESL